MVKSHRLYAAGRKKLQKNAAPATNIQHWTTACKKFYKTLLNPADQIFAAAEFVKPDRLHSALQSHEPVRLFACSRRTHLSSAFRARSTLFPRLCMLTCEVAL